MNNIRDLVLNVVIIILTVVLVIALWFMGREFYDEFTRYQYKENSFVYAIEDGDYDRVVDMYHTNVGTEGKEKKNYEEYYGVAKYFENAFFYKVYWEAGDAVRAERYQKGMDAAAAQMGDFAFLQDDINAKLGFSGDGGIE